MPNILQKLFIRKSAPSVMRRIVRQKNNYMNKMRTLKYNRTYTAEDSYKNIIKSKNNYVTYDKNNLTSSKAKKILEDGSIEGKALTDKQKRYFGWIAGGKK